MARPRREFFSCVDKNGPIHPVYGQCWAWTGSMFSDGYGRLHGSGGAHRVSWKIHYGDIPSGLCVCHKCDNRSCVNPEHLFLGTSQDNTRDRCEKGRSARNLGERNGAAELTAKEVIMIRSAYVRHSREFGISGLAKIFGVSKVAIHRVVRRSTWRHV